MATETGRHDIPAGVQGLTGAAGRGPGNANGGDPGLGDVADDVDLELLALPAPTIRERRMTVALLAVTAALAAAMAFALRRDAMYAVASSAHPIELSDLRTAPPSLLQDGAYVCGRAPLGAAAAIRFERPFERDSFRLAPVLGRRAAAPEGPEAQAAALPTASEAPSVPDLWVEVRVPEGSENGRFVPPATFCGRLVPFAAAGLRHRGLSSAVQAATGSIVPESAWLLVDGDEPARSKWAVALVALFTLFAAWNATALVRLIRPAT